MGGGRLGALIGPRRFQRNDRFYSGDFFCHIEKTPAVFQAFDMRKNDFYIVIFAEIFQGICKIQITAVGHVDSLAHHACECGRTNKKNP